MTGNNTFLNAFGTDVPYPLAIVTFPRGLALAQSALDRTLWSVGVPKARIPEWIDRIFSQIDPVNDQGKVERTLHAQLVRAGLQPKVSEGFGARATLQYRQVKDFIVGKKVLDYGCGDGLVGALLSDSYDVTLADVDDYRAPSVHQLPYQLLALTDELPFSEDEFDTVLLLTVLHHADDPVKVLRNGLRVASKRLIVIESVFGIEMERCLTPHPRIPWDDLQQEAFRAYRELARNEQLAYCAFIDWFYNRVLHVNINLPFSYNTPEGWRAVFQSVGAREVECFDLGLDQVLVPEFHTLHIVDQGV